MQLHTHGGTLLIASALLVGSAQAQSTLYQLPGTAPGGRYGEALRSAGDVDADGIEDLIVGSKAVFGYAVVVSGANGQTLHSFASSTGSDGFGTAVAGLGDLDGDGAGELCVGAPLAGTGAAGAAYVYDGASGALLTTLNGGSADDHFGWAVAGIGDVDLDLVPDLAVGAIDDDNQGASSGTVRVVSGATFATLRTLEGTQANQLFGWSLAGLPDLDGDGAGELAVGAPHVDNAFSTSAGEALVFSGASGALLFSWNGFNARDAFGRSVAHAGDVNGDGLGDVAVGAPQPIPGQAGYARVFSGLDGSGLLDWGGDSAGDRFGTAVASAGDLNGDGRSEVAVGAPLDDDHGSASGSLRVFDGASALALFTRHGAAAGAELGTSLDLAGDLNGDLESELLASAPGAGAGVGQAEALSGTDLGLAGSGFELSLTGSSVSLALDFGAAYAGRQFIVLGSTSGIAPGTPYGSLMLAVNKDRYFKKALKLGPGGYMKPPTGTLDAFGKATVSFAPPLSSATKWLSGQTFHHVAVLLDAQGNTLASTNAWPVTIVP